MINLTVILQEFIIIFKSWRLFFIHHHGMHPDQRQRRRVIILSLIGILYELYIESE